jgi:hypothetical protein
MTGKDLFVSLVAQGFETDYAVNDDTFSVTVRAPKKKQKAVIAAVLEALQDRFYVSYERFDHEAKFVSEPKHRPVSKQDWILFCNELVACARGRKELGMEFSLRIWLDEHEYGIIPCLDRVYNYFSNTY